MKLIDIQRHFFRLRGDKNVYFCTEAETTANLNNLEINYENIYLCIRFNI